MKKIITLLLFSVIIINACKSPEVKPVETSTQIPISTPTATPASASPTETVTQAAAQSSTTSSPKETATNSAAQSSTTSSPKETATNSPAKSFDDKTDYEKMNQVIANATSLMKKIPDLRAKNDSYCTDSFRKLVENPDRELNIDYIDRPEAQKELKKIIGDEAIVAEFTTSIKKFYQENSEKMEFRDWSGICKKNKEIYAFFDSKEDPSFRINLWENGKFSEFFHDEQSATYLYGAEGGVTSFITNALDKNSILYRFIKDQPGFQWTIDSFNPDNLLFEQIEKCKLSFEYTQNPFFINADKYTLTCDKEYKP